MTRRTPSAADLAEHPELAALHLLDASLATAEAALLAAHCELEQADFFPQAPPLDSDAWLADSIRAKFEFPTHLCFTSEETGLWFRFTATSESLTQIRELACKH